MTHIELLAQPPAELNTLPRVLLRCTALLASLLLLTALVCGAAPQDELYGDSYTAEELAALDRALWGANLTRQDLRFDKDMAKGHACFPVVREMLDDPLLIAPVMDRLADACRPSGFDPVPAAVIHAARLSWGDDHVMPYEQWADHSEWAFDLSQGGSSVPWTPKDLVNLVATDYDPSSHLWEALAWDALRLKLPELTTWRDVFTLPVDLTEARIVEIEAWIEAQPPDWYMRLLSEDRSNGTVGYFDSAGPTVDYLPRFSCVVEWAQALPSEFFPTDEPLILDTPVGAVVIGTYGDDVYRDLDCALVIEPGGNDTYINCRLGGVDNSGRRSTALFIDLGGDDLYDCADIDFNLGAAFLGRAAFYDLGGGNDRYYGGNVSLGAAIGGVATFYDDGGSDFYSGKVYTQGAAAFGIAVMYDDAGDEGARASVPAEERPGTAAIPATDGDTPHPDSRHNDYYTAHLMAQGFARTRGVAICVNTRGNDIYHAGGVYLHAPLFSDRYQSFSQGFAIGERGIDYAGGIALLADYDGNDRYLGDVYNQGVGYWYSAGFLYDGGGNDHYEMTQYGQGSGIHLAVGGLIDESGSDTYVMHSGLGQGGSHDYAASVFMDRGGDDRYLGNTSCNGTGLTNSVGLFFDRGGNDLYAARRGSINVGRPARGFGSIGVLVDLGGEDDYLGPMRDDLLWLQPEFGVGIDVGETLMPIVVGEPLMAPEKGGINAAPTSGFDTPSPELEMPTVIAYEGPLTQEVFDELWEIAIRWEVGDNRVIVPAARQRLIKFGPEVLPLVEAEMDDPNSLAVRAFNDVLKAFVGTADNAGIVPTDESTSAVYSLLTRQLADASDDRKTAALRVIGDLKLEPLGTQVAMFLDHPDPAMQRRVVGVLGQIGSHAADERLLALLDPATDEALLKVVVETVTNLELNDAENAARLGTLLGDPRFSVRDTLRNQLALRYEAYAGGLSFYFQLSVHNAGWEEAEWRALRTVLRVYLSTDAPPTEELLGPLDTHLHSPDSGVRADAALLVQHWGRLVAGTELAARFEGNGGLNARAAAVLAETGMPERLEP